MYKSLRRSIERPYGPRKVSDPYRRARGTRARGRRRCAMETRTVHPAGGRRYGPSSRTAERPHGDARPGRRFSADADPHGSSWLRRQPATARWRLPVGGLAGPGAAGVAALGCDRVAVWPVARSRPVPRSWPVPRSRPVRVGHGHRPDRRVLGGRGARCSPHPVPRPPAGAESLAGHGPGRAGSTPVAPVPSVASIRALRQPSPTGGVVDVRPQLAARMPGAASRRTWLPDGSVGAAGDDADGDRGGRRRRRHAARPQRFAGSDLVTVEPGDTLWSVAARTAPRSRSGRGGRRGDHR